MSGDTTMLAAARYVVVVMRSMGLCHCGPVVGAASDVCVVMTR